MTTLPLSESDRSKERLEELMKIRLAHMPRLQRIDTDNKRAELVLWKLGKKCPPLMGWLLEKVYEDPGFFDRYDLESPDTTLRDNRDLERLGYFEKAKKQ